MAVPLSIDALASVPEQRCEPGSNLVDRFTWAAPQFFRTACFPIHAPYVIGENYSRRAMIGRDGHFKRVSFHLIRDGTNQCQTGFCVVYPRTQHQRRAASCLLAAGLRAKRQPDQIAPLWHVGGAHQDSLPCGKPQSVSRWRFLGVIRATSSDSSYLRRAGRRTMLPSLSRSSARQSPSLRRASLAIARGIRTARLFPHFETVVSFRICIYCEYTSDPHAIPARPTSAMANDIYTMAREEV